MADFIDREQVMQAIGTVLNIYSEAKNFVAVSAIDNVIGEIVDEVPAADVAPVVHGCWSGTVCTACGESTSFYYDCAYCPNCGAKMDGGERNERDQA